MATAKNGDAAPRQVAAERITVSLVPKTSEELQALQDRTGMSKTDLVNRAITLYAFLDGLSDEGFELLRRRAGSKELELIRFL